MSDDYSKLQLGSSTSLIAGVNVSAWGSEVLVRCRYDPTDDRLPYCLLFQQCRELKWEVIDFEYTHESEAELIGIHLGAENYQAPALIQSNLFTLVLLYKHFRLLKSAS